MNLENKLIIPKLTKFVKKYDHLIKQNKYINLNHKKKMHL